MFSIPCASYKLVVGHRGFISFRFKDLSWITHSGCVLLAEDTSCLSMSLLEGFRLPIRSPYLLLARFSISSWFSLGRLYVSRTFPFYSRLSSLLLLFICQVVFDSLRPHGLQHTRPLFPSPPPRVCPSLCSLSRWCHLAISSSATLSSPSAFPSIRVFSNESAVRIRWSKYWSFSVSPSSEYSGLIFFRMVWFDFLPVQGTLKNLF